jgi:hypothetical protein
VRAVAGGLRVGDDMKRFNIVVPKDDGGVELYPMKEILLAKVEPFWRQLLNARCAVLSWLMRF